MPDDFTPLSWIKLTVIIQEIQGQTPSIHTAPEWEELNAYLEILRGGDPEMYLSATQTFLEFIQQECNSWIVDLQWDSYDGRSVRHEFVRLQPAPDRFHREPVI